MLDASQIVAMQTECVLRWHQHSTSCDDPATYQNFDQGLLAVASRQHRFNYDLWHEEDIARSPDVSDAQIAQVKRNIDKLNQQRNDWIEKLDDWITDALSAQSIAARPDAKLNTETPGSAIDRLSIIALRIYHLQEQLERVDVDASHREKVTMRLQICKIQQADLANSLQELMQDIVTGVKRHRTYRQYKMYNDPTLNPYLYQAKTKA